MNDDTLGTKFSTGEKKGHRFQKVANYKKPRLLGKF